MCQLNSYFVPKILSKNKVLAIMQAAGMDCCEAMDDYEKMLAFKEYHAYFSAPQRCNCGSIISSLQGTDYKNFEEFKVVSKEREITRLENIRDFMLGERYEKKRRQFEKERERLSAKIQKNSEWLGKKEQELTDTVMLRTDISDEEKSRLLHETVYPILHTLIEENEKRPEVIAAQEAYQQFTAQNTLMWDSTMYTLEKVEPKIFPTMPLTLKTAVELSGYAPEDCDTHEPNADENEPDTAADCPTITLPSNNIFEVIEAAKNKGFSEYTTEFETIERFIAGTFVYVDRIKLFAYWQTDDCIITETRAIDAKDFTIDSLLFLPYLTLLEIRK